MKNKQVGDVAASELEETGLDDQKLPEFALWKPPITTTVTPSILHKAYLAKADRAQTLSKDSGNAVS